VSRSGGRFETVEREIPVPGDDSPEQRRGGVATKRDELLDHLKRAGELEVSGEDQTKTDSYFDTTGYRFHGTDGFEADYSGLTKYFKAVRAAFDDRSIRRGIISAKGNYIACRTSIEGSFAREFTHSPAGPLPPSPIRRSGSTGRGVGTHGLQKLSPSTRSSRKITAWT
jgi:hypothetical protein